MRAAVERLYRLSHRLVRHVDDAIFARFGVQHQMQIALFGIIKPEPVAQLVAHSFEVHDEGVRRDSDGYDQPRHTGEREPVALTPGQDRDQQVGDDGGHDEGGDRDEAEQPVLQERVQHDKDESDQPGDEAAHELGRTEGRGDGVLALHGEAQGQGAEFQLVREHLRRCLVETTAEVQPLGVAKLLKAICDKETPQLVILGKQAIDDDSNQTGQMLAALLNWSQATFASKVTIANGEAEVMREIDGGMETVAIKLPAIITTDLRLNTPRYATLPNIMKAKKKPLDITTAEALGVDISPRLKTLKVVEPPKRKGGVMVANVAALIDKLKNEAKVI